MSRRRRVRQIVLQVLFQQDLNPGMEWEAFLARRLHHRQELIRFGTQLVQGVAKNREELDRRIVTALRNWKLARLSTIDRNVLRLATFEMLQFDTPPKVAIDEAIELARRFGSKDSASFVNGVLDRVYQDRRVPKPQVADLTDKNLTETPAVTLPATPDGEATASPANRPD